MGSYGGLIGEAVDPFGLGDPESAHAPRARGVGKDYLALIQAYARGAPTTFQTEQEFKPQYIGLDVANLSRFGAPAVTARRAASPETSRLLEDLTRSASTQLASGTDLDPALARLFSQQVRGAQAARGMGHGPSDVLQESVLLTQLGNTLRQQRQGFASQVVGINQAYDEPAFGVFGAGPSLIKPEQSYDTFNTAYNARAAANIANANNSAAASSY